jgi:hypothetical protein
MEPQITPISADLIASLEATTTPWNPEVHPRTEDVSTTGLPQREIASAFYLSLKAGFAIMPTGERVWMSWDQMV